jgi:TP901 family phage tail tape measure protein
MADRIEQTFGIDASQALQALQQLDTGFGQLQARLDAVANSMSAFNRRATRSNTGLTNATNAANTYNTALNNLANQGLHNVQTQANNLNTTFGTFGRNSQAALGGAARSAGEFTVSWETLSRVVQTQIIVRVMNAIRDAVAEAVDQAVEFQNQVTLIQTIADGASFQQIANGVRSISNEFNLPLLDTAKGVYQALSNQVGDFGESLRFTEEAAKFAKATNSSLADSVDLLSGALRSYGLTVEDTGRISGIFFTAIDKGRVTADQLANAFGRVGPSAQEVGISLEELAAAAASISDKGIATSETLTQFRGIITALTKPTDAMKKQLAELGFTSSETAIRTLGLSGVLKALAQSANGSTNEFAKLFPNVRGIGGALSLTGENLETFARNIDAARENGEDFANSKFLTATDTDAERLTSALNKLQNAFTVEVGQALVKAGAEFFSVEGRVEFLTSSIGTLAAAIPNLTVSVGGLAAGLGALRLAAIATASPMALLVTTAAALAVAIPTALQAIDDARTRNAFKDFDPLQAQNAADLESFRKAQNDKLIEQKKFDDAVVQGAFQRIAKINAQYLQDVENAKSSNKAIVLDTQKALEKIVDARQKFASELNSAITDSRNQVRESVGRIQDIQTRQSDRKFEFDTRGFSDAQKVFALTQRAADTARQAEQSLKQAFRTGDDQLRSRALAQFQRADALGEQARQIGENANNRALELKAARDLEAISQRQINAEREINAAQAQRQKALAAERDRQEKIVEAIREQQKIVLDNTGLFDKNQQLIDPDEQARRAQRRGEALKKIAELAFSSKDFKAADALGLGQFVQTIQNDLQQRPIQLAFDVESNIAKVEAAIRKSLSNIDVQLPFLSRLEKATGQNLRQSPDQINKGISDVAAEANAIRQNIAANATLDQEIAKKRAEIQSLIQSLEKRVPVGVPQDQLSPAQKAIQETITQLKTLSSSASIDIGKVNEQILKLQQTDFGSKFGEFATDAKLIQKAFEQTAILADKLNQQQSAPPINLDRLQELDSLLKSIGVNNLLNDVNTAATTISNSVTPIGTIEQHALNTATYYERAALALQNIGNTQLPAIPAAQTATAQFGKMLMSQARYFAKGGLVPRGMDTVPVMARRGESILTPEATSRWFSQIQAMNAGQQPVFRQNGGSVTNIGDVSITVKDSGSPNKTARAVMREFQREKRRGTGRI